MSELELQRRKALLEGLQLLFNMKNINIMNNKDGGTAILSVEIGSATKMKLLLDESMKLQEIKVEGAPVDIDCESLLQEARQLPSPQDLRLVMAYAQSMNERTATIQAHISDLRKQCIVKQINSHNVQLILSNGTIAELLLHDCYPDVPCGVFIQKLSGGSNLSHEASEKVIETANAMCCSNLQQMHTFLKQSSSQ